MLISARIPAAQPSHWVSSRPAAALAPRSLYGIPGLRQQLSFRSLLCCLLVCL
ncbi:hypothetical protein L1047_08225 [Synechococcus sp. Nb3U1]|uniref:hypothetical protein n=1 Tax=Synechococcus sp. Nb3U1 TaxID=1914529 RepID=UPI001F46BFC0|nr:hypothetical protein [Synechococcus sp. Nb3U1]MCF2971178.1 hypothetical protein [Synechococcus sp. Nb3U1]